MKDGTEVAGGSGMNLKDGVEFASVVPGGLGTGEDVDIDNKNVVENSRGDDGQGEVGTGAGALSGCSELERRMRWIRRRYSSSRTGQRNVCIYERLERIRQLESFEWEER
jgi:hypothetical protein